MAGTLQSGAILSVAVGLLSWLIAEAVAAEATVPPQLVGLGFSLFGMVMGSYIPAERRQPQAG